MEEAEKKIKLDLVVGRETKTTFWYKVMKVLVKQIVTLTNLYEAHKIGEGTMRITAETLLAEIEKEIKKLGK